WCGMYDPVAAAVASRYWRDEVDEPGPCRAIRPKVNIAQRPLLHVLTYGRPWMTIEGAFQRPRFGAPGDRRDHGPPGATGEALAARLPRQGERAGLPEQALQQAERGAFRLLHAQLAPWPISVRAVGERRWSLLVQYVGPGRCTHPL